MANKKRKTLQIKRPDPNSAKAKKKALPKVDLDEKAATSAIDTENLGAMGPKTAKLKRPDETKAGSGSKGKTTRIALPDEDKIRRARRANATQDLEEEGALPSAEQIEQAQSSATMPIMIDTENVEQSASQRIPTGDTTDSNLDQTMEIDSDALSTGNLETQLVEAGEEGESGDQTMQIDPDALATRNLQADLQAADDAEETGDQTLKIDEDELAASLEGDQTMQIDPAALATGNLQEDLEAAEATGDEGDQTVKINEDELASSMEEQKLEAAAGEEGGDQTVEIDPDALATRNLESAVAADEADADKTMQIDPASLQTGQVDAVAGEGNEETMRMEDPQEAAELTKEAMEESFNAQTMQMTDLPDEAAGEESELTKEGMEESFNAQTMEMDPRQLEEELAKASSRKLDDDPSQDLSQTMDLSEGKRPKTIMIKRPTRESAGPNAPTVKAARPDASTVRTARPVTAHQTEPKESTSRIDVPGGEGGASKEGKTIKLRRPAGRPTKAPSTVAAGVASRAGLELSEDGTLSSIPKRETPLGAAWLAVAIITLLVSLAAVWTVLAVSYPEVPMPGRLVDVNNQLISR